MARSRNDTGARESRRVSGESAGGTGHRELVIQLDPEAPVHEGDTEAEERGGLPWRCQIVRIEQGGELDRALGEYMRRWKARTGRNLKRAPAIRGLLRQALLAVGCVHMRPEKRKKTSRKQMALWPIQEPFVK